MKTSFSLLAVLFSIPLISQSADDEKAIRQVMQTISEGWTNGSGEQYASVFADDHDFIVWTGYYLKNINRQKNAASHQAIFDTFYKGTQMHYVIDKIKFIREDVALVHVLGALSLKTESRPKDPQVLWTSLLEKTNGSWKIISFHNLDLEVFKDEGIKNGAPMPAEVMYASWYNEAK